MNGCTTVAELARAAFACSHAPRDPRFTRRSLLDWADEDLAAVCLRRDGLVGLHAAGCGPGTARCERVRRLGHGTAGAWPALHGRPGPSTALWRIVRRR